MQNLAEDKRHFRDCHARWIRNLNRDMDAPEYKEEWRSQQCGACLYWIELIGVFGDDYGACTNRESQFDRMVRFEHDGCDKYVASGRWD